MSGRCAYMKLSEIKDTKVEVEKEKRITPSEFPKTFFPSLREKSFLPLQLILSISCPLALAKADPSPGRFLDYTEDK